jgi:hypothetical protein
MFKIAIRATVAFYRLDGRIIKHHAEKSAWERFYNASVVNSDVVQSFLDVAKPQKHLARMHLQQHSAFFRPVHSTARVFRSASATGKS